LEGDALARIGVEDLAEDGVEFVRDRKDGLQKVWVAEISRVRLVSRICPLPWISSAGEVDEDHSKGPDVVGGRLVAGGASALVTFGRHIEGGATTEVGCVLLSRGQAKVRKLDCLAVVAYEDVLRLEIAVVDFMHVAMLHGVEQLEKDLLCKSVVANIVVLLGYGCKEIALWAILHYDINAVWGVEDFDHGNNVRMLMRSAV